MTQETTLKEEETKNYVRSQLPARERCCSSASFFSRKKGKSIGKNAIAVALGFIVATLLRATVIGPNPKIALHPTDHTALGPDDLFGCLITLLVLHFWVNVERQLFFPVQRQLSLLIFNKYFYS